MIDDISTPIISKEMTCGICYNEVEGYEELMILRCGHIYCEICLREYIAYQVSVGKVQGGLCCPDQRCSQVNP